jgi:hypothetical protein
MTRSELLDRLAVLLGGRVAEELVFDEISTGAQNDLQRASDIARSMVTEYGMSDRLGLVSYERPRQAMFLPESFSSGKNYSEAKAAQIDEEVARFVEEAHQRVRKILSERRTVLMIWPISRLSQEGKCAGRGDIRHTSEIAKDFGSNNIGKKVYSDTLKTTMGRKPW